MGRDEGRGDVTGWESVNQEPRVSTHAHTHTHTTHTHTGMIYLFVCLVVQRMTQEDPHQDHHHSPDPWM